MAALAHQMGPFLSQVARWCRRRRRRRRWSIRVSRRRRSGLVSCDGGMSPHSCTATGDGGVSPHSFTAPGDGGVSPHKFTATDDGVFDRKKCDIACLIPGKAVHFAACCRHITERIPQNISQTIRRRLKASSMSKVSTEGYYREFVINIILKSVSSTGSSRVHDCLNS